MLIFASIVIFVPSCVFRFGDETRLEEGRDVPAVMGAGQANALAQQLLARAWAERDRLAIRVPTRHLSVEPGATVELPICPSRWTVDRCTVESFACVFELRPESMSLASAGSLALAPFNADPSRTPSDGADGGEVTIALFEAPPMSGQASAPTVLLAASSAGPGWRGADVEITAGAHKFAERTARRKSVLGRSLSQLGPEDGSFEVELVDRDQWLLCRDREALGQGANLALLGSELIQFGESEAVGPGRFRLSQLVRRQGGTSGEPHETGERFVLLERDALRPIVIPGWLPIPKISARLTRRPQSALAEITFQSSKNAGKKERKQ